MAIIDAMAAEYKHETGVTRKVIERVPEDKYGWKPHERSMSAGQLASHLVEIQGWVAGTIAQDEFKMDDFKPYKANTKAELLKTFDALVEQALQAMKGVSDQTLMKQWRMTAGGKTILEMPKVAVLRGFIVSHQIHHRGQMSVYLRLLNIPVPAIYGPSADEQG